MPKPKYETERVEVEWVDAQTIYEQKSFTAAREHCTLVRRFTLGYLVVEDKERVVIAGTFDPGTDSTSDDKQGCDFTVIPRGWVKNIKKLGAVVVADEESVS